MSPRATRGGLLLLAGFLALAAAIFLVLGARFGGPAIRVSEPFLLRASLPDGQGLTVRSDVLLRGVRVGHVRTIRRAGGSAALTVAFDVEDVVPRRGTTLRVGTKTALGEAYVDVVPGPRDAAALRSGATLAAGAIRPSVEVDEALEALSPSARRDLAASTRTWGEGTASPEADAEIAGAIAGVRDAVGGLHRLGDVLGGQADDVASIVDAGGRVAGELAARRARLGSLVAGADRTLRATAAGHEDLRATVVEAPRLLRAVRRTLADADPLVPEARRLVADARAAAPDLAAATRRVPAVARDADRVLRGAAGLRRAADPVLDRAPAVLDAAGPVTRLAEPVLANAATMTRYFEPRKRTIAAWFSNTAAIGTNGDAKGRWARFFVFFDPATLLGMKDGLATNAYTGPGDAADNQPYRAGDFPRLRATPAPVSPELPPASR
ncbi:MlaD family protein [Patulibacter brassicae]|uniref:MlaD family protein n=1 Tax=Patulibacter brassicae TaxID=1705717 RepID=A0ABU4VJ57_9ACTN|nr:MlaD family protein [Patulibacter brassicae]MDX8151724.1 MlaD family protein [Patulibacter brassicae]